MYGSQDICIDEVTREAGYYFPSRDGLLPLSAASPGNLRFGTVPLAGAPGSFARTAFLPALLRGKFCRSLPGWRWAAVRWDPPRRSRVVYTSPVYVARTVAAIKWCRADSVTLPAARRAGQLPVFAAWSGKSHGNTG